MKNRLTLLLVAAVAVADLFAQSEPLTLQQALNPYQIIRLKRPQMPRWEDLSEAAMPYEDAKGDPKAKAAEEGAQYSLQFTNTRKVWRYNTRGDYFLVSADGKRRQLGQGLPESSLMFAKISPDGRRVAYVSKNNIYVEDCAKDGSRRQLTTDGCDTIVNGTFDWVYEEEFDCRDGFRWSGDSRYIAFWHSNTSGTGWFDIINNVDSIYPTVSRFPYPKAGTLNSDVSVFILDVETGQINKIGIEGDQRENYLPRMEFEPGTNHLMIQQMNRAQNTNKLWTCNIVDGKAQDLKVLLSETDKAWVETNDNVHWLAGNKWFTWTSERDGWRHIYRISADGKKTVCITKGNFDVVNEVALDEKNGYIYFVATEHNATERYLYRAKLMGNGECENITAMIHSSKNMQACGTDVFTATNPCPAGQYSYSLSPACDYAIETYSSANQPSVYSIVKMNEKGQWTYDKLLEDNREARDTWQAWGFNKEFVKVKSGDLELDAWIIKPRNFDPSKKYPVIDYVYGEPASATVQNRWETSLFWQFLAQQGYVVVSIENRGANAPRGREWRKCIYGEVGVASSEDQSRGIIELCNRFPWMDRTRLGITGWSGGGAQTLNCMFRYPEVWKTGVAIAFVSDQRLYDTIYQERYMNTPQANPDGYFRGSPINFSEGLKGNLLLIHGTGDDNVHYQNTEMLVNRLVAQGKTFYQVSYPMRTHSISERQGSSFHLRNTLFDFFNKNL